MKDLINKINLEIEDLRNQFDKNDMTSSEQEIITQSIEILLQTVAGLEFLITLGWE